MVAAPPRPPGTQLLPPPAPKQLEWVEPPPTISAQRRRELDDTLQRRARHERKEAELQAAITQGLALAAAASAAASAVAAGEAAAGPGNAAGVGSGFGRGGGALLAVPLANAAQHQPHERLLRQVEEERLRCIGWRVGAATCIWAQQAHLQPAPQLSAFNNSPLETTYA